MGDDYPNIADHGLIGDLQTAALIDTNGTIDWFCAPRFDSPSVFGSLVDAERGGFCSVRPDTDDYVTRQLYLPNTAILITRFMTEDGVGELIDFMPIAGDEATDRHRLVRMLRVVRGTMSFTAEIQPSFGYGRARTASCPPTATARCSSPTTCRSPCIASATRCSTAPSARVTSKRRPTGARHGQPERRRDDRGHARDRWCRADAHLP